MTSVPNCHRLSRHEGHPLYGTWPAILPLSVPRSPQCRSLSYDLDRPLAHNSRGSQYIAALHCIERPRGTCLVLSTCMTTRRESKREGKRKDLIQERKRRSKSEGEGDGERDVLYEQYKLCFFSFLSLVSGFGVRHSLRSALSQLANKALGSMLSRETRGDKNSRQPLDKI